MRNLQPSLKLTYDASDFDLHGIVGEKWSINIPYIQRVNKYGTDKLYNGDATKQVFSSCVDGELIAATGTSAYVPRIENGSFNSYTAASHLHSRPLRGAQ